MKTATKIVSGVLVVALVVVAALAIAGVFNVKNASNSEIALANNPAVAEQSMFRGTFTADTVLYVKSVKEGSKLSGDTYSIIRVKDAEGKDVKMVWQGDSGIKPENGWTPGMYYNVNLMTGYEFVNEELAGLDAFECIIKNRESTEADTVISGNVIYLAEDTAKKYKDADMYTLVVPDYDKSITNPVFVYNNGLKSKSYVMVSGSDIVTVAGGYKFTVQDAQIDDVYDSIYVNKSYGLDDGNGFDSWEVDELATEASIRSSAWFIAAVDAIYGESMASDKNKNEFITVKFNPGFEPGSPSKVKLDVSVKFAGIIKNSEGVRDKNSYIEIKLANVFTPVFDVHIQNEGEGKAFDAALRLDVETTAGVYFTCARSYSSNGDDANATLESIANKVAALVRDVVSDKLGNKPTDGPYYFAKWIIPIGALPICIEDNLGVEIKASFSGQVGVVAKNSFSTEVGVVYANGEVKGFGNVDDDFHFEDITLAGTAGVKVGLVNEIGISAYGVISVDLGLHAGVYADVAGRLALTGEDIVGLFKGEGFNIVAAYYLEAGVYVDLDISGKVFGFNIAKATILAKKFPLYTLGHKWLPVEGVNNPFVDETIYMESSYYYLTNWDVNALDIQDIAAASSKKTLAYTEFDYEVGPNLRLDGNRLVATVAGEFESYVKVTSKVNKHLSKTVTIIKNPEMPSAIETVAVYDMKNAKNGFDDDVFYSVMLNGSKLIGVSIDGSAVNYTYSSGSLKIDESIVSKYGYGAHTVLVESSKGYLSLVLRVISSADIEVDTAAKVYDKAAAGALVWDMALQGNAIASVEDNGVAVDSSFYSYRDSDGKFVMTAAYWSDKALGDYSLVITLANKATYTLGVTVKDSRPAALLTSDYVYIKGSNEDLQLQVAMYDNAIEEITFAGSKFATDSAVIGRDYFDGKAAGTYQGSINGTLDFTVTITEAKDPLVIPVQNGVYYKSQNNDVTFDVKKMPTAQLSIASCDGFVQGANSITIKGDFLKGIKGDKWQGTIQGASNTVTITIEIVNDLLPSLSKTEYEVADGSVTVGWNLQGYSLDSIYVEGLSAYTKTLDGLQVKGSDLAYGVTNATIYTPVNALSFSIAHSGTPSISASYALNKNSGDVVTYKLDVAHLAFSYLTVDNADILPIQWRYNDGELTLSNDFAYNLAAGTYNINVYLSDNSVLHTKLIIQGEAKAVDSIGGGTSLSPYLIYTADQLAAVYSHVNDGNDMTCYKLMADIDMFGVSVEPIGNDKYAFNGIFDGNGYTISNLSISKTVKNGDGGYAIGLFGIIGESGKVSNLCLSNASVTFAQSGSVSAGLIAGCNKGLISGVYINGSSVVAESKSFLNIKNAFFDLGAVVGYNVGGTVKNVDVRASIKGTVKGLNVAGLQVFGRKSIVSVGGVVGYFGTNDGDSTKLISNIKGSVNVDASIDNGKDVNINGWYGYTDLSEKVVAECAKHCKISICD